MAAPGPGGHTSARGGEGGQETEGKRWGQNEIVPKLLEPPPQDEGEVGRAGGGARAGIAGRWVQAGGSSPGGAGKPLRSRPMISLTVKDGQLRDGAEGNSLL